MHRLVFAGLCAAVWLRGGSAWADEPCHMPLVRLMSLDMGTDSLGEIYVPMTIDGHVENLLVDTGGLLTTLTPGAADALGLVRKGIPYSGIRMYGGTAITDYVTAKNIAFGTLKLPSLEMLVLPNEFKLPPEINGILGPSVLDAFDVDFDFSTAKLSFFSQEHCPGRVVYWTRDDYAQVAITVTDDGQIKVPVELDGKTVTALVDSGATVSVMSLETAEDLFDLDEKSPGLKPLGEKGDKTSYHYPFKSLAFQGITVNNPDLVLVPDAVSNVDPYRSGRFPKLILGRNILRQLHIYIAYKEKNIYVTPASAH